MQKWILVALFFVSFSVRFPFLSSLPPLLTQDEASIAFNAKSILETGKDEWGVSFPLVFSAFGDAKQPIYIYATSVVFWLFGHTGTQVRWVSVLAGSIFPVLLVVWLSKRVSLPISLLAGLAAALSPWTIHMSRMALESNLALTLFLGGLVAFEFSDVASTKKPKKWGLFVASAFLLSLSTYTYIAYRLVVPLFLIATFGFRIWQKSEMKKYAILVGLVLVLIAPGFAFGQSQARLNQVGLLAPERVQVEQDALRNSCHMWAYTNGLPVLAWTCAGLWNQWTMPSILVAQASLRHLDPSFLFVTGDTEIYRSPGRAGLLFSFLFPVFLIGVVSSLPNFSKRYVAFFGYILALIPSTLVDAPQAIRLTPLLPFAFLFLAYGLETISLHLKKRNQQLAVISFVGILMVSFATLIPRYIANTFAHTETWLAYGKEIAKTSRELQSQGYTVIIYNVIPEPHIFLAFWLDIPAQEYHALEKAPKTDALGFRRPTRLGDTVFFTKPNYQALFCSLESTQQAAVIVPKGEIVGILPFQQIKSENNEFVMAEVYRSEEIQNQAVANVTRELCNRVL